MGILATSDAASKLSTVVTADMLGGVLSEIVSLLPVLIPVMVSFIGLRKGIAFVRNTLQSA